MLSSRLAIFALSSTLALAFATTACGSVAETPAVTAASAATKAPVATAAHGPVKLLGEALADVALRADQRTEIEKLAREAEARHEPVRAARAEVAKALADQIEKNAIDAAALQPNVDAAGAALATAQAGDRAALERLHAILDAKQRTELVDALRARFREHHGAGARGAREKFHAFAEEIGLTSEQQEKIKGLLHEQMKSHAAVFRAAHEGHKRGGGDETAHAKAHHGRAGEALEAFKGEAFSLDAVAPRRDPAEMARRMSEHVVGVVKVVLPELTPEQRVRAAAKVRARAESLGDDGL